MTPEPLKTHSFKHYIITFFGKELSGFGGVPVKTVPLGNLYTSKVGPDGSVVREAGNNPLHTITVVLMSTSAANLFLSALVQVAKEGSNAISDVGLFVLKDFTGTTVQTFEAWITKAPDLEAKREASEYSWTLEGIEIVNVIGGK